ncbi:MAG TPA: PhoU domain-containing protein, partial [Pyrinomonadaceae bacterium]|nr:PhoU domain-containing protein [Pyrinomonadaceae bacterium]
MQARSIIASDDEIDELYDSVFQDLITLMVSDSTTTKRAARLLFVAKHLERIGDYVTDICELTVYMAEAAFIKHSN